MHSAANWFSDPQTLRQSARTPLEGKTNKNYRLTVHGKDFHLKVRQHDGFPSFKKLQCVNELLAAHGVPYTPIVETIPHHPNFPLGAVLFEWKEARKIVDLSEYEDLLPRVAGTLKAIHAIQVPYYENIDLGLRTESYPEFITAVLRARLNQCKKDKLLDASLEIPLTSFIGTITWGRDLSPVLVHRDATKSNVLLQSDDTLLLIDWDNAEFTTPLADIARIIFAYKWNLDDDKRDQILSTYLGTQASIDEENILRVEYMRNALEGLIYKDTDRQYCHLVLEHLLQ